MKNFLIFILKVLLWLLWMSVVIYFAIIETHIKPIPQVIIIVFFLVSTTLQIVRYSWISKGMFLFLSGFVFFITAWRLSDQLHYLANPVVHPDGHYTEPEFFVWGPIIGGLAAIAGCKLFYHVYSGFEQFPRFASILLSVASIAAIIYDKLM
jgi:hypothetical protein